MKRKDYNLDWSEHFRLDENSPSGLSWNRDCRTATNRLMYKKGDFCLSMDSYGYWQVSIRNEQYKAHIVIWNILYGVIPEGQFIDHIDGDRSNNNIENLRLVSRSTNNRNSSKRSHNTTGHTGITIYKNCYKSKITYEGKQFTKYFNFVKLGKAIALSKAIKWRDNKLKELNAEGADFSERHGK